LDHTTISRKAKKLHLDVGAISQHVAIKQHKN
jgi:hypothetical protein